MIVRQIGVRQIIDAFIIVVLDDIVARNATTGDDAIADIGLPARILAAADMNADRHGGRRRGNNCIDDVDVGFQEIVPIIAPLWLARRVSTPSRNTPSNAP